MTMRFLRSVVVSTIVMTASLSLAACSSGSGSVASTSPSVVGNDGATIGQLSEALMQPASAGTVNVQGTSAAPVSVDIHDQAPVTVSSLNSAGGLPILGRHTMSRISRNPQSEMRSTAATAVNSPLDLQYIGGGPVVGSSVSHIIYVNCNSVCRASSNVDAGNLVNDIGKDQFITLLYQYLTSPGVLAGSPLTARFTKGTDVDITVSTPTVPAGFVHPVVLDSEIEQIAYTAAAALGKNGGYGDMYHVVMPNGWDVCFDATYSECYAPDAPQITSQFLGYHGAFGTELKPYLYSLEVWDTTDLALAFPYAKLPHQVSPGIDPADQLYSVLAHELFETITDPIPGSAWWNVSQNGEEVADLCEYFNNNVSLNNDLYFIQSMYSDLTHQCVSPNLAPGAVSLTP